MSKVITVPRNLAIAFYFKHRLWKESRMNVCNWITLYRDTVKKLSEHEKKLSESKVRTPINNEYKIRCMVLRSFILGLPVYSHLTLHPDETKEIDTWNFVWNFDSYIYICQKINTSGIVDANVDVGTEISGVMETYSALTMPVATMDNATFGLILLDSAYAPAGEHSFSVPPKYIYRHSETPRKYSAHTCVNGYFDYDIIKS